MFIVTIPTDFAKLDGRPFRKVKEDKDGKPVRARDEKGNLMPSIKDAQGNESYQLENEVASFTDILSGFLNTLFAEIVPGLSALKAKEPSRVEGREIKPLKVEDSSQAADVFRAIHVCRDGVLELEKTPREWLVRMLESYGIDYFGAHVDAVLGPLKKAEERDPSRSEVRREDRQEQKKKKTDVS